MSAPTRCRHEARSRAADARQVPDEAGVPRVWLLPEATARGQHPSPHPCQTSSGRSRFPLFNCNWNHHVASGTFGGPCPRVEKMQGRPVRTSAEVEPTGSARRQPLYPPMRAPRSDQPRRPRPRPRRLCSRQRHLYAPVGPSGFRCSDQGRLTTILTTVPADPDRLRRHLYPHRELNAPFANCVGRDSSSSGRWFESNRARHLLELVPPRERPPRRSRSGRYSTARGRGSRPGAPRPGAQHPQHVRLGVQGQPGRAVTEQVSYHLWMLRGADRRAASRSARPPRPAGA